MSGPHNAAHGSNFGSEARTKETPIHPNEKNSWHTDDDWYRMFLDSAGNALTVIHCFTDVLGDHGGGTLLCEDGMKGGSERDVADPRPRQGVV